MRFAKFVLSFVEFHKALSGAHPLRLGVETVSSLYRISQGLGTPGCSIPPGEGGEVQCHGHRAGSPGSSSVKK